tara:strand:+ start:697 stop:942 length:246 start_codon:yes stop_codon:yes gene_type:complete
MKFIAVKDGVSVRKEEICCVERSQGNTCRVYTESTSYESEYSYESILMLLEQDTIEEAMSKSVSISRETSSNLWGNQHFAG